MTDIKLDEKRGTYYFVHDAGRNPLTGKRKQIRRTGFKNVSEAKRVLKQVMVDAEKIKNTSTNVANMTFKEFSDQWLENKKISIQHNTYVNTVQNFRNNVYPYIGNIQLKHFNNLIIQNYINNLSEKITINGKRISPATIARIWRSVREVLYKVAKKNAFDMDELDNIYLPKITSSVKVWDKKEIAIFLNATGNVKRLSRHYVGMAMTVMTGMRMGEVLGLRWKDISFSDKTFSINQTLVLVEGETTYKLVPRAKTESSKAIINVPERLLNLLLNHKQIIERDKERFGKSYCDNDLVVCTKYGTPLFPANFRKDFNSLIKRMGLPIIRFHDLRHTHATFLLSQGTNPKLVQERLRHSNIKTTLGTYSHVMPQMHIDAVDKFNDITE